MNIKKLCKDAHINAKKKNYYSNSPYSDIFYKIHEENEEFLSACITKKNSDIEEFENINTYTEKEFKLLFEEKIKNSIGDELADIIIVALAGSVEMGIDIEKHIIAKMSYNEVRDK